MSILLDTNACSAFFANNHQALTLVRGAEHVYISAIVLGELLQGFLGGSRFEQNNQILQEFLMGSRVSVLNVTSTTSSYYAEINRALRAKGRPIPTNDIWIAAHAMETGAQLISADRHFEQVDGIVRTRVGQG